MRIDGQCDPEFAALGDTFAANFRERGETGAAICLYKGGVKRVDLWGGWADAAQTRPWVEDTIICMMSVGKGMAALCLWMLVDRGLIDMDAPVARYWPEFAQAGKGAISVDTLVTGRAGLLYADHAPDGAGFDWETMVRAYAMQAPEWEPGTLHAYHSASYGYLIGELVRRVDGRRLEDFLEQEVSAPLGVNYGYGTRGTDPALVADILPNPESHTFVQSRDPTTKMGRAWRMRPESPDNYNDIRLREGVMPSTNGHGNARAVAHIYAALACGGTLDGVRLVSPETIDRMRTESWFGHCEMTDRIFRYARGFFLNDPAMSPMGANPRTFGHPGAGGAIGFADPENRISFSYSPALMCSGGGLGERCAALTASVYA
ncbi:EstA family serine hydrolase [Sphingomonas hengshuiensis]|uniref:EstA family serine hydrolase n=1 Tax=Sphingomonas hengshuiensis TaxID=1609977 RepID=UPI0005C99ADA|nr:EstA family serine hydrolase [Sphingomonas hengshuiensis]